MNPQLQDKDPVENADTPSDEEAFDAAMSEFDGTGSEPPADDAASKDQPDDDLDGADEDAAPADDAAEISAPAAPPPGSDTPQNDVWANAPAELREAREREVRDLDLKYRSAASRQAALQRQIDDLRKQAETQPGSAKAPDAKASDGGADDEASKAPSDALAQLREDYPDLAGPLLDRLEELAGKVEKANEGVGDYQRQQAQAYISQQETVLSSAHPDWPDVVKDERFAGWVDTQPQAIKDAMARNHDAIIDGNDAALVVGQFKAAMGIGSAPPPASDPKPHPTPSKRDRQLQGNRDTGRSGPAATTGIAKDDFDAAVEAFSRD